MIQLFHVSKTYQGAVEPALRDVNLHLQKGEFAFLTGHSGAGKSTLLKLLYAAERPSRGQILIAGQNITRLTSSSIPLLRRNIGIIFQDFKLLANRTVYENVALVLEVTNTKVAEIPERVYHILRHVGLAHKLKSYPPQLSGGEQQRVSIARALVNEPQIILADEPTGNLDKTRAVEILDLIKSSNDRGTTALVATHNQELIQHYGDRLLNLEQGRLIGG